jgi:signal transduction histidine kinase
MSGLAPITELPAWATARALAEEQAALRRISTLVAEGVPAGPLFEAVTAEAGALLGADLGGLARYLDDGRVTAVATWSATGEHPDTSGRWPVEPLDLLGTIAATGRPARLDDWTGIPGPVAAFVRTAMGVRSSAASPIIVEGRVWGALVVHSTGDVLSPGTGARLADFTELVATAIGNAAIRAALARSTARLVEAADAERKRVVADLHDGAQQRLVHAVVTLKLAEQALALGEDAGPFVAEAMAQADAAIEELRELAHGTMPLILTRGGLLAGVESIVARVEIPVEVDVSVGRLAAPVEAAAYFVVSEALTNVAKHARATRAGVVIGLHHDTLRVEVRDDGVGGAAPEGHGLVGLADRVSALGGSLAVGPRRRGGTVVRALIPVSHRRAVDGNGPTLQTVNAGDAMSCGAS